MKTFKEYLEESADLSEAAFVSSSPSTAASVGVKFDVKKDADKSVGTHVNGDAKEHHDVFHGGKHIGSVSSYSAYQDKKPAGSRIVTSRKDVRRWSFTLNPHEHNQSGNFYGSTPEDRHHTSMQHNTKKDALQALANAHKSNTSR